MPIDLRPKSKFPGDTITFENFVHEFTVIFVMWFCARTIKWHVWETRRNAGYWRMWPVRQSTTRGLSLWSRSPWVLLWERMESMAVYFPILLPFQLIKATRDLDRRPHFTFSRSWLREETDLRGYGHTTNLFQTCSSCLSDIFWSCSFPQTTRFG